MSWGLIIASGAVDFRIPKEVNAVVLQRAVRQPLDYLKGADSRVSRSASLRKPASYWPMH